MGEDVGLPIGQGTLTALRTREGAGRGSWRSGREMGGREEVENFKNIYIKKERNDRTHFEKPKSR